MVSDPFAELRATLSENLSKYWPPEAEAAAPRKHTPRQDSARYGIAAPAPANALREEVAEEIAAVLRANRRSLSDLVNFRPSPGESADAPDTSAAADAATITALPVGARLKPRGVFEDDWSARPTPQRPWPVVLLHGTTDTKGIWQLLGGELREDGWAVFAPDYGHRATGALADSAAQVGAYIDAVLQVTGAQKVILVGHSQGGLLARYWMRTAGTAHLVRHVVCLSAPNHGTTQGGIVSSLIASRRQESVVKSIIDAYFGPAGMAQIVGSATFEEFHEAGDLEPGVTYTCIATRQDTVVVPPETCFLEPGDSPDGTVRNIYVQDFDRRALVNHMDMPLDKRVRAIVRTVLKQIR
ncbi:esterase/lipase family protein [Corynebacterium lizhenjunii]|uniref:esterase/lipase family protein n=1 Tax=Corynebacterium lizhenjunii TaxID=2709394 RepID=UPI00197FB6EF|nr:triacylglycerol lipase [Corynebacterium lizhenjunii]